MVAAVPSPSEERAPAAVVAAVPPWATGTTTEVVQAWAIGAYAVAAVEASEIDATDILRATLEAMASAAPMAMGERPRSRTTRASVRAHPLSS